MTGYLQITSPAFQGNLPGSYWTQDKTHDPWKLPNCIPIARAGAKNLEPLLAQVRERIAKGYWKDGIGSAPRDGQQTEPAEGGGLSAELKELGELHRSGVLTDEEFQQATNKLLS
jgi:hypothetical protein